MNTTRFSTESLNSQQQPASTRQPADSPSQVADSTSRPAPAAITPYRISQKVRSLHVINGEHYSGAERVQDLLAQCLPATGVEVEFACLKPDLFPGARHCQDTPLHSLAMSRRWDMRPVFKLARLAMTSGAHVLHAHTPRAALITSLAAPLCRRPWVFHVHSPTLHDSTRAIVNRINHWVEALSVRQAASVICVSDSMQKHMRSYGVKLSRLHVVPNGVPRHDRTTPHRATSKRLTIGTVALFRPRKGTEILLEALFLLKEAGNDICLRAVGGFETPEYEQKLKDLTRELDLEDRVTWTGFTHDVTAEWDTMDVFALPSLFGEGMPMVVLEAMAVGVPVVASRVEGVPQVIEHGEHGLLVRPGDSADLATKLQRLLTRPDLSSRLSLQGRRRQQTSFSDQSMANGVAEVYESMIQLGQIRP